MDVAFVWRIDVVHNDRGVALAEYANANQL